MVKYIDPPVVTRDLYYRAARFERPDFIPMTFAINAACFHEYPLDELFGLMEDHPFLFPNFKNPGEDFKPEYSLNTNSHRPYTDDFGCVWETPMDGLVGTVKGHPLDDWAKYNSYVFPDPEKSMGLMPIDWAQYEREVAEGHRRGDIIVGALRHGHTFLQLSDLRGYENLLFDMMDEEPLLDDLIEKLTQFNIKQIEHLLKANVDVIAIPDDLGMQTGPMLRPEDFHHYIKPCYERLCAPARKAGTLIHMHSDGDIRLLVDDIIEGGTDILNLQDVVNGVDWIGKKFRGKTCIELDVDRQKITPYGTPKQIDALIREEVEKIGCKEGGLMMLYGLYPGVPLENAKAVMDAMERYAFYYNN